MTRHSPSFLPTPESDDPKPMRLAIDRLTRAGISFERPTVWQLKVDEWNFYPGKGTIFRDGDNKRLREKGLDAFISLVRPRPARGRSASRPSAQAHPPTSVRVPTDDQPFNLVVVPFDEQ